MKAGMKTRLLPLLLTFVLVLAVPFSCAWAAKGDLDEILDYRITVDVNEDATTTLEYHLDWKVLDSTTDGPLTWVRIGIPNSHYVSLEAKSDTVKSIRYDSSGGSYVRIDLDRAYHAGEVASFDFEVVQDYMYQVGRDNQGEAVYEFTPGWFDDIEVDNLLLRWNGDKVERIAPAAQQDKGYYTWQASLRKGQRFTVTVGYPDDAFAFDIDKTIGGSGQSSSSDAEDIAYGVIGLGVLVLMGWGFVKFVKGLVNGVTSLFDRGSGFTAGTAGKKITRTKVVYYPVCQGCGAARPEGGETCEYCGRSFIKSEETITEKDIPKQESEIKRKNTNGEYAYSTEPNTFLRVRVVPIPVSSGSHTRHRSSGSSRSCACACASSCACACGCACACACAGGGRAGCSTKDFYNTNLKLRQLESKSLTLPGC